ncbi:SDR family NAD(P)-dependent oxidoreductase [Streptomyces sp. NBC_00388]|uniref:SDR family NAD(P)-dependent oxidoreductase n=1 Tax=Streptomyces sp. NBC_00388 TaxID=2975735 RepID=UPI002E237FC6
MAIVGVGFRLPGGISSMDELWSALTQGRDLVTEVPEDRFPVTEFKDPNRERPGKTYTVAGGFLEDIAGFDASYFGVLPREASRMDPQQRLLLECATEAFDDAGIDPAVWAGSNAGVFMGVSTPGYKQLQQLRPDSTNAYTMTGGVASSANRISHAFDLHGPSIAVDTACASSLTALHQACEALRTTPAPLVLAGGANVLLAPSDYVGYAKASMLSPSGRCHAFSAQADGFVRSEGAGVVLLKRLPDAVTDGDRIHGLVLATGVNAAGRTQGISLPSAQAQEELLRDVYSRAGLDPDDLVYVEAHGTGTPAGDPVECAALGRALGKRRTSGAALPIGSVKSNMGHLEQASGIVGVFKSLLVLRHGEIPVTLHAEPVSEAIDFEGLGLEPVLRARPVGMAAGSSASRGLVGVNSFGFGGANAHVVLGQAPQPAACPPPSRVADVRQLPVMVSARSRTALTRAAELMAARLEAASEDEFYDLAWTASRRHTQHSERAVVLAACPAEAALALRAFAAGQEGAVQAASAVPRGRVGFVFAGNGSQWAAMGIRLLQQDAEFQTAVEQVDGLLSPLLGWSVLAELAKAVSPERLERAEIAQPLLFAVQVGLVAALAKRGVSPAAVAGHSVGEVAAAHAAGALDLEQAARVVAERSRAQAPTAGAGRMAAVGLPAEQVQQVLAGHGGRLELAAVNTVQDVTVSGDAHALEDLYEELAPQGVFFRELEVDYAFHSSAMDRTRGPLLEALAGLSPNKCDIPFVSTVTGAVAVGPELDAEYWWRNVREPVLFGDAVTHLLDSLECSAVVDVGPHPVLAGYVRRQATKLGHEAAVVPTLSRSAATSAALDAVVARLMAAGADVDWQVYFPRPGRVVDLPAYPWERERHWNGDPSWWLPSGFEPEPEQPDAVEAGGHPLLGLRVPTAEPAWHNSLEPARLPWLGDHKVGADVVLPGTAYVEMALAAGHRAFEGELVELDGLDLVSALVLPWDDPAMDVRLQTSLSKDDGRVSIASRTGSSAAWHAHARGRVRRLLGRPPEAIDLDAVRARMNRHISAEEHQRMTTGVNLPYGPAFHTLTDLWAGSGEVLASYTAASPSEGYRAHPTLTDGALQASASLWLEISDSQPFIPTFIESVRPWRTPAHSGFVHVRSRAVNSQHGVLDVTVTDSSGAVAWELNGCVLRRLRDGKDTGRTLLTTELRGAPLPGAGAQASPLPAPSAVVSACAEELSRRTSAEDLVSLEKNLKGLKELAAHFTTAAITTILPRTHNGEHEGGVDFGVTDLINAGVDSKHSHFLNLLIDSAVRQGLLRPSGRAGDRRWYLDAVPEPEQVLQKAVRELPSFADALMLLGNCGGNLSDVLRGRCNPTDLLFSDGDWLAERFYDLLRPYNRIAEVLLQTAVSSWPEERPLRILEIGGGTGGITTELLPHLPPSRTQYVFTDISSGFFQRAQRKFAAYDFVDFRALDLDRDPVEQGFVRGSFDIVIAANSLHTAKNLVQSLGYVSSLLADGGHLLAVEWHDEEASLGIFGLLDSFWASTDTRLRPNTPWLPSDDWPSLLGQVGFCDVAGVGQDDTSGARTCSVLLASRQPREDPCTWEPSAPSDTSWLLAADEGNTAAVEQLATALAAADQQNVRTTALNACDVNWPDLLPQDAQHANVVLLWGESTPPTVDDTPGGTVEKAAARILVLQAVARACAALPEGVEVTLWIVNIGQEGRMTVLPSTRPADAAVWGAGRSLGNEQRRTKVKRIAVHHGPSGPEATDAAQALAREFLSGSLEDEVVLGPQGRFVPRVLDLAEQADWVAADSPSAYGLRVHDIGMSYRLDWEEDEEPAPGPGQVAIRVRASAVNYRDALTAMGLVPPAHERNGVPQLGLECAGTVVQCGPDVTGIAPGDRVFAVAPAALGAFALARADMVALMPDGMAFSDAATLPVVYLTAHYSLEYLARLRAGETVLVHSAAGGVGLAALQCAQARGARVIATAGTEAKRTLLRLLGVEHVLDSRTLEFADQVRQITNGRGVDVVLSALSGEAQVRSLELLACGGRFVELGKRDFLSNAPLPTRPFLDNLAFFGADITPLVEGRDPAGPELFEEVAQRVHRGIYKPLMHHTYPAHRVGEALDLLRHSRHTGKVVLTFDEPVLVHPQPTPLALDPDATYLVTGGLGGFGAATARWLADHGARRLALVGRRGAHTPEATALLQHLTARGVTAIPYAADAADVAAMRGVCDAADASGSPIRGVIHAAMVLDDGPLDELTDAGNRTVLHPKIGGGYVLDNLTRGRGLDFFVVYSSTAALVGNSLQANYVAANMAVEALVHQRKAAGESALAVQWGLMGDVGILAREERVESLRRTGLGSQTTASAFAALEGLFARPDLDVVAVSGAFDWERISRSRYAINVPRLSAVIPAASHGDQQRDPRQLRESLAALPAAQVGSQTIEILAHSIAQILRIPVERLGRSGRLSDLGIDSLMATELAVAVERTFGCTLTAITLLNSPSLADLSTRILAQLGITASDAPSEVADEPSRADGGPERPHAGCLA